MKKILTVLVLAIVFVACKKDNDDDATTLPINPEGLWAGKVKLKGITDSVQLSLTLLPDNKAKFTIFKAVPETFVGTWQFTVNSLKVILNSTDSLFLQAGFDGPNNRFKGSIFKNTINQGDFFLYKREPLPIEGTYVGHFGYGRDNPSFLYTLILNPNGTIKDNSQLTGTWQKGPSNTFEARLENPGEVTSDYFYTMHGDFDPATGILTGSWDDNEDDFGRFFVQKQ